jgi:hypothetical protein
MQELWQKYKWIPMTIFGSAVFAAGFAFFLQPNDLSPGGISGLALLLVELTGIGSVGVISILMNLQLFINTDRLPGPADIFPRQAEQLPAAQAGVITNSQGDGCVRPGVGYHPPELVGGYGKPFLFLPVLFDFDILHGIGGNQAVWFDGGAE